MRVRHLIAGAGVAMLAACGVVRLPVSHLEIQEGPLAASHPPTPIPITSKYTNNDGVITFALPDGTACKGNWSLGKGRAPKSSTNNQATLARGSGWVAKDGSIGMTGDGNTVVNHGDRRGLGLGTGDCTNGATFRFSFVADGLRAKGALRDSNGNLFRFVR